MPVEFYVHPVWLPEPRLAPYGPMDLEAMEKLRDLRAPGGFRAVLTMARSANRNRWFHALISAVAQSADKDPAWLKLYLKIKLGLLEHHKFGGEIWSIPASTAFAKMDEAAFASFCDRAVRLICAEILPGAEEGPLRNQINDMLGIGRAA